MFDHVPCIFLVKIVKEIVVCGEMKDSVIVTPICVGVYDVQSGIYWRTNCDITVVILEHMINHIITCISYVLQVVLGT
jgi:hypothetical protein